METSDIERGRKFNQFFVRLAEEFCEWKAKHPVPDGDSGVGKHRQDEPWEGREFDTFFGELSPEAREETISALAAISSHKGLIDPGDILIRPYRSGELGIVSQRHCALYRAEYGFDDTFESYLIDGMSRFLWDCGKKGEVWVVDYWGRVMGAISIVETGESEAQLRWFYLEPSCRGLGLGRKLMETALSYCRRKGIGTVFLWTVKDLEAARYLYVKYGFTLKETNEHFLWGRNIVEEKWEIGLSEGS